MHLYEDIFLYFNMSQSLFRKQKMSAYKMNEYHHDMIQHKNINFTKLHLGFLTLCICQVKALKNLNWSQTINTKNLVEFKVLAAITFVT